jgi:hypothetical protein
MLGWYQNLTDELHLLSCVFPLNGLVDVRNYVVGDLMMLEISRGERLALGPCEGWLRSSATQLTPVRDAVWKLVATTRRTLPKACSGLNGINVTIFVQLGHATMPSWRPSVLRLSSGDHERAVGHGRFFRGHFDEARVHLEQDMLPLYGPGNRFMRACILETLRGRELL